MTLSGGISIDHLTAEQAAGENDYYLVKRGITQNIFMLVVALALPTILLCMHAKSQTSIPVIHVLNLNAF